MPRYVALLRGINVGGHQKVAMAELRQLLERRLGFAQVRTLLQSGNAVFDAPRAQPEKLADRIEKALAEGLGVSARCLVRSGEQLQAVIDADPLRAVATEGSRYQALFLSQAPEAKAVAAHDPRQLAPQHVRLGDQVIYQWCPDGILEAPNVSAFVEKHWKVAVTGRSWNTVLKIGALLRE